MNWRSRSQGTSDRHTPAIRRALLLILFLIAAVALASSDPAQTLLHRILDRVRDVILAYPVLGKVAFILLSAVSAMLAFFSTAIVVPVAVYAWGRASTLAMLWGAWLIGGIGSYAIGRTVGRRIARWLVSPEKLDFYASRVTANAPFFTVLLFQLALPSEIPGYVLGGVKYPFLRYVIILAIAELPFAIGSVYLGETFVQRQIWPFLLIGLLGVASSVLLFRYLHTRIA